MLGLFESLGEGFEEVVFVNEVYVEQVVLKAAQMNLEVVGEVLKVLSRCLRLEVLSSQCLICSRVRKRVSSEVVFESKVCEDRLFGRLLSRVSRLLVRC